MFLNWIYWFQVKTFSLFDYTNFFSPNDYENNDKIIIKYFQLVKRWKNYIYCIICGKHRKFENRKISSLSEKHYFFLLFVFITQEFRLKNIDETKNYLTEE